MERELHRRVRQELINSFDVYQSFAQYQGISGDTVELYDRMRHELEMDIHGFNRVAVPVRKRTEHNYFNTKAGQEQFFLRRELILIDTLTTK